METWNFVPLDILRQTYHKFSDIGYCIGGFAGLVLIRFNYCQVAQLLWILAFCTKLALSTMPGFFVFDWKRFL
jgi:hypothetical protein